MKKKIAISVIVLFVLFLIGGGAFMLLSPQKQTQRASSKFLKEVYDGKGAQAYKLTSPAFQKVNTSSGFKDLQYPKTTDFSVQYADYKRQGNTIALSGVMVGNRTGGKVQSFSFAIKLVKDGLSWRIDAYEIT